MSISRSSVFWLTTENSACWCLASICRMEPPSVFWPGASDKYSVLRTRCAALDVGAVDSCQGTVLYRQEWPLGSGSDDARVGDKGSKAHDAANSLTEKIRTPRYITRRAVVNPSGLFSGRPSWCCC
jgi:hypothetical protein